MNRLYWIIGTSTVWSGPSVRGFHLQRRQGFGAEIPHEFLSLHTRICSGICQILWWLDLDFLQSVKTICAPQCYRWHRFVLLDQNVSFWEKICLILYLGSSILYSWLPNTSRGWNNSIGWKIPEKSINVGDGINVLGGKFCNDCRGIEYFFLIF